MWTFIKEWKFTLAMPVFFGFLYGIDSWVFAFSLGILVSIIIDTWVEHRLGKKFGVEQRWVQKEDI